MTGTSDRVKRAFARARPIRDFAPRAGLSSEFSGRVAQIAGERQSYPGRRACVSSGFFSFSVAQRARDTPRANAASGTNGLIIRTIVWRHCPIGALFLTRLWSSRADQPEAETRIICSRMPSDRITICRWEPVTLAWEKSAPSLNSERNCWSARRSEYTPWDATPCLGNAVSCNAAIISFRY